MNLNKKILFFFIVLICFKCNCKKNNIKQEIIDKINPNEPTLIWNTDLSKLNGGDFFSAYPLVYKNLVIYTTFNNNVVGDAKVFALNKETGEIVWQWNNTKSNIGIIANNMFVINNILVFAVGSFKDFTDQIVALDLLTGKTIWHNIYEHDRYVYNDFIIGINNNFYHFRTGGGGENKYDLYKTDATTGVSTLIKSFENNGVKLYIAHSAIKKFTDKLNNQYLIFGITKSQSNTDYDTVKEYTLCNYSITKDSFIYIKNLTEFGKIKTNQLLSAVNENGIFYSGNDIICFDILTGINKWNLRRFFDYGPRDYVYVYKNLVLLSTTCYDFNTKQKLWNINRNANGSSNYIFYNYKMYYTSLNDSRFHCYDLSNGQELFAMYAPARVAGSSKLGDNFTDGALTLDTANNRFYAATYKEALCFKFNP